MIGLTAQSNALYMQLKHHNSSKWAALVHTTCYMANQMDKGLACLCSQIVVKLALCSCSLMQCCYLAKWKMEAARQAEVASKHLAPGPQHRWLA